MHTHTIQATKIGEYCSEIKHERDTHTSPTYVPTARAPKVLSKEGIWGKAIDAGTWATGIEEPLGGRAMVMLYWRLRDDPPSRYIYTIQSAPSSVGSVTVVRLKHCSCAA